MSVDIVAGLLAKSGIKYLVIAATDPASALKHCYFAYGSNMSAEQVQQRTPGAEFVCTGVLKDYKLTFVSYAERWKGGVANIEHAPGSSVPGVVWAMSDAHLQAMDGYEVDYIRVDASVTPISGVSESLPDGAQEAQGAIKCIAYQMHLAEDIHDWYPASAAYLGHIEAAYHKYKIDPHTLHVAQEYSTKHPVGFGKRYVEEHAAKNAIASIEVNDLTLHHNLSHHLSGHGIRHVTAPNGDILIPKHAQVQKISSKVREIIKILQRDPSKSLTVHIDSTSNVPSGKKSVTIKNNSMVEGSWILTTTELSELFGYQDYFPVELQLSSGEHEE